MARVVLAFGGAALGAALGGPLGARIGFGVGAIVGGVLFPPKSQNNKTPFPEDLDVQQSQLGSGVTRLHGTRGGLAGALLWLKGDKIDVKTVKDKVGGKGGFGAPSQTTVRYVRYATFIVGVCEAPDAEHRVLTIEMNGKPVADFRTDNNGALNSDLGEIEILTGGEDQLPDPDMQADLDVGDGASPEVIVNVTNALRGILAVKFKDWQLQDYGGSLPNVTFTATSEPTDEFPLITGANVFDSIQSSEDAVYRGGDGNFYAGGTGNLEIYDPISQTSLFNGTVANPLGLSDLAGGGGSGVSADGDLMMAKSNANNAGRLNFIDLKAAALVGQVGRSSLFPGRYDLFAGAAEVIRHHVHPTLADTDDDDNAVPAALIALRHTDSVSGVAQVNVFNPNRDGVSVAGRAATNIGVATKSVEGGNRTLGWPAIDDELKVWCPSNDANNFVVHEWQWDRSRDAYAAEDAGEDTYPVEFSATDITADIVDLGTSADYARTFWVKELNAVLILFRTYAYLFDCDSRTVIGEGIQVTAGTAATNLRTTMIGGVGVDGKIIFKDDSTHLSVLNVREWTLEVAKYDVTDWSVGNDTSNGGGYVYEVGGWLGVDKPDSYLLLFDRLIGGKRPLDEALQAEAVQSPLTASELTLTALSSDTTSIAFNGRGALNQIIQQWMTNHFFDLTEIDGKLTAVKRGGALAFTIDDDDLGAHLVGGPRPVSLLESRAPEHELPWRVDVDYISEDLNWETGNQHAKRIDEATASRAVASYTTGEVLADDEAKAVAERLLREAWEGRREYKAELPPNFIRLDPTDRGTVTRDSNSFPVRLIQSDRGADWIISLLFKHDRAIAYSPAVTGSVLSRDAPTFSNPVASELFLLDLPALRNDDSSMGHYQAAGPVVNQADWPGALSEESDDGVIWSPLADLVDGVGYGYAQSALPDVERWTVRDLDSSLVVRWVNGDAPATVSDTTWLARGAVYAIGAPGRWEIVLPRDVTDNGDGSYTLSTFLRGRLGTEDATSSHEIGDAVVRLDAAALRFVNRDLLALNDEQLYRVTTLGQRLPTTERQNFTDIGRSLRPLSPTNIKLSRESNGDITIRLNRRTKQPEGFWVSFACPLVELSESYEVDIHIGETATIARTLTVDESQTVAYTRPQQLTDGNAGDYSQPVIELPITNPGFETGDLTGWTTEAGSWSVVTTSPHSGTFHARGTGGIGVTDILVGDMIDLVAAGVDTTKIDNRVYAFIASAWWANENHTNNNLDRCWMGVRFYDVGMAVLSTDAATTESDVSAYEQVTHVAIVPTGTRYAATVLYRKEGHTGGTGLSHKMRVDDVTFEYAPIAVAGFDLDAYQISDVLASVAGDAGRGIARSRSFTI